MTSVFFRCPTGRCLQPVAVFKRTPGEMNHVQYRQNEFVYLSANRGLHRVAHEPSYSLQQAHPCNK